MTLLDAICAGIDASIYLKKYSKTTATNCFFLEALRKGPNMAISLSEKGPDIHHLY